MQDEALKCYREAGRILQSVMKEARAAVDVGVPLMEVAELVEGLIAGHHATPAFPCNISLDRIAAHYTPSPGDMTVFGEQMVKLDIGVMVDGYIADSATTVDLSGHDRLAEASSAALDAAIELVKPGVSTAALGKAIQSTIEGYGYRPVANLTGHGLQRYMTHMPPSIPNISTWSSVYLQPGDVIAIEPFATDGVGRITEGHITEIFGFSARRPVRSKAVRELGHQIEERYGGLPFARRWLTGERLDFSLNQLLKAGVIHKYPVLWEAEGALVSQAEHTVLVLEDGKEVTTRAD